MKTSALISCAITVASLFLNVTTAHAATNHLWWRFDDWPNGPIASWEYISDSSGNGRGGYAMPSDGTLTAVPSTLVSDPDNRAVRFETFHVRSRLFMDYLSSPPVGTFSNGVSSRIAVQIDTAVTWDGDDYYQFLLRYRLGINGNDLFGMKYYVGGGVCIETRLETTTGVQTLRVTQSAIETQLGYSILGRSVVYAMTWDAGSDELTLYVDGQSVGSMATTGDIALGSGLFIVGNRSGNENWSRQGIYDEVKVWDGALTASEVMADYRELVPLTGTMVIIR